MGASESLLTRATLDLYRAQITRTGHHLEIGTKAGWYLMQVNPPLEVGFTLTDKNPYNLTLTRKTLESNGYKTIECVKTDIFDIPDTGRTFQSVGMNFVFNQIPGSICTQMDRTIESYKPYFDRDVTIFGNTLLGFIPGHPMNPGVARDADFLEDGPEHIECILNRHFEESNVQVVAYDPEHGGFGVTWWGHRLRWKRKKVPPEFQHLLWGQKSYCVMENPAELVDRVEQQQEQAALLLEETRMEEEAKSIEASEVEEELELEEEEEREKEFAFVRNRSEDDDDSSRKI